MQPGVESRFRSVTMPVLEAVQTFVGITNENEFYSHHYLARGVTR